VGREKASHLVVLKSRIESHSEHQNIIHNVIYSYNGRKMWPGLQQSRVIVLDLTTFEVKIIVLPDLLPSFLKQINWGNPQCL